MGASVEIFSRPEGAFHKYDHSRTAPRLILESTAMPLPSRRHAVGTPRFSVVIPAYNRADSIRPTLLSVRDQTFDDFECIVVDDGSDDRRALRAVVDGLSDPRFTCVWRVNGGGGAARNTGIDNARGRYVAFLDSDDLFLPQKLGVCADRLKRCPEAAVYSYILVDRGVDRFWTRPSRPLRKGEAVGEYLFVANEFIQTSSIVVPRAVASKVRFDADLRKGQDLDFCVRLSAAGVRFYMIEQPLVIWRDNTEIGRVSRTQGYDAPLQWLKRSRQLLTRRAVLGYRATVLAYYLARERPLLAAIDLLRGWSAAGVPTGVVLRQALRTYLPRRLYRRLVNCVVASVGSRCDSPRSPRRLS